MDLLGVEVGVSRALLAVLFAPLVFPTTLAVGRGATGDVAVDGPTTSEKTLWEQCSDCCAGAANALSIPVLPWVLWKNRQRDP